MDAGLLPGFPYSALLRRFMQFQKSGWYGPLADGRDGSFYQKHATEIAGKRDSTNDDFRVFVQDEVTRRAYFALKVVLRGDTEVERCGTPWTICRDGCRGC